MDENEIRKRLAGRAAEYVMFKDDEEENAKTTAEVSSSGNVIVFPDFEKLKSEVEKMRTELSMLLLERDELQFVICKNIETEYMLKLGSIEYKAYEAQCAALRLKRKIELIQAKKHRQEKVIISAIEETLDNEFAEYQKQLDEQIDKMNDALKRSKAEVLSDEDNKELKKLYLANTDPEFLRQRLGKNGVALWNYANGNDLSLVAKKDFVSPIKSVGHGITTVADLEKPEQVWPVFLELTQDIGHKLRVHGLSAEGVAIHIRDNTLDTRQWQTKIALPTQSPMVIAKTAFQLFEKRYGWLHPIRSVTVQAINLIPQDTPRQIDMFMDAAKQDKLERMEKCVEEIRRRFGKDSIRNGVLCQNLRLPPEKAEITMPTGMVG